MPPRPLVLATVVLLAGCRRADEPPLAAPPAGLACPTAPAGGDRDACGDPPTAASTFD